jgi:hypothetical protein
MSLRKIGEIVSFHERPNRERPRGVRNRLMFRFQTRGNARSSGSLELVSKLDYDGKDRPLIQEKVS